MCALALLVPSAALAADFRSSESGTVSVTKNEVVKNVYLAGTSVSMDAHATGDVIVAGSSVTVAGDVDHSVAAAGSTIIVKGNVAQSVRVAGSDISIYGSVGEDLLAFGSTVNIDKAVVISGDAVVYGSTVNINGQVNGYLRVSGSSITISGIVNGNVEIDDVSNLTVTETAVINGSLTYASNNEAKISTEAIIKGEVTHNTVTTSGRTYPVGGALNFMTLISLAASLLVGLILIYWLKKPTDIILGNYKKSVIANVFLGLAVLIVTPIAGGLLLATFVGTRVAGLLLVLYFATMFFAAPFGVLMLGQNLRQLFSRGKEVKLDWSIALIGVVAGIILGLIPIIGWAVLLVYFLLSLGAMSKTLFTWATSKA